MYETLTRNSATTCRTGTPSSTAARTRKRRSFECGIPIVVPSVRIKLRPQESQILRSGNLEGSVRSRGENGPAVRS